MLVSFEKFKDIVMKVWITFLISSIRNKYCARNSRVGGRLFEFLGQCRALLVAGSENLFV
jgi:hypothetical protein